MVDLRIFSVSEYIDRINDSLYEHDGVVEGEVSEYKVNQQKWIFFKIKDESSVLDCFSTVFKLRFPLEDGMRVRVYGRPSLYAKTGKFSMNVQWAEPAGEGAMKRAFELLKTELQKEGLFAQDRKRTIPRFPKRIGLIASRESAAYGDFLKVLKQRFGNIDIHLFHVQVQGSEAIDSIVGAFSCSNRLHKQLPLDMVVLIRGGGSMEDLSAFNSKEVAYAVFGSAIPVVCGVGHEQDETIADYVADLRASTPSNAAELITPHRQDIANYIDGMTSVMETSMERAHSNTVHSVDATISSLDFIMTEKVRAFERTMERIILYLKFFQERITMHRLKIDGFLRLIRSFSPKGVLDRGYALVKKGTKVITSIKDLKPRDIVSFELKDGEKDAEIM